MRTLTSLLISLVFCNVALATERDDALAAIVAAEKSITDGTKLQESILELTRYASGMATLARSTRGRAEASMQNANWTRAQIATRLQYGDQLMISGNEALTRVPPTVASAQHDRDIAAALLLSTYLRKQVAEGTDTGWPLVKQLAEACKDASERANYIYFRAECDAEEAGRCYDDADIEFTEAVIVN